MIRGVARSKTVGWTEDASSINGECGARAYNGGLGQSRQRGPGAEPVVRESRGRLKLPSKPKIVVEMDRTCELLALESFSDYCK